MYPKHITKTLDRARVNIRSGNPAAVLGDLSRVVQEFPNEFDGWMLLGHATGMMNDHASAEACFRKAAAIQPKSPDAWHNLGLSYAMRGM
ncbi:MAG: tetratricopeptide repeat protein, partial [Gallionellaceae bacterium]|nr:tetratricopeptide repeat protein [Gallionellaceae bacterium]